MTRAEALQLLRKLDAIARRYPYPPLGLPIHGDDDRSEQLTDAVLEFMVENQPEASR